MAPDRIRSFAKKYGGKTTTAATVLVLVLQNAGLIGTFRGGNAEGNGDTARYLERHIRQEQEIIEVLKEIRSTNRIGLLTICVQLAKVPDNCLRIQ